MEESGSVFIPSWEKMSYFSAGSGICWFMEKDLEREIVRMHEVVGNAVTEGKHLVVGVGSTQLFQAALFALSPDSGDPIDVVSASPFYSVDSLLITIFLFNVIMGFQISLSMNSYSLSLNILTHLL